MSLQPPNSLDTNVNDLRFFWSIQKKIDVLKAGCKNLTELIQATQQAYEDYEMDTLDRCFGCLVGNFIEILKHNGDNNYPTPHFGNRERKANNIDVCTLTVEQELIDSSMREVERLKREIDGL
jgi:hypothetical protein